MGKHIREFLTISISSIAAVAHAYAVQRSRAKFHKAAEGLTLREREVAQRFWDLASENHRATEVELRTQVAALREQLAHLESLRVALDRLNKASAQVNDPACDREVALSLVHHWSKQLLLAVGGLRGLEVLEEVDKQISLDLLDIAAEVQRLGYGDQRDKLLEIAAVLGQPPIVGA